MRTRVGLGFVLVMTGVVAVAPLASAAPTHSASVTQKYRCATPVGPVGEDIIVSGTASASHGQLALGKVTFEFLNNFGTDVTINKIRFVVPDPDRANAPYQQGSAKVDSKPKGWTAGHQASGIFEFYAGTQVLADGATIAVPGLSAAYRAAGPKGTLVEWKPGPFSFNVKSPDPGLIACKPKAPVKTFASVQE
jgi:hypothetical protein